MTKQVYDSIIIGAGAGGLNVASFFARLGLRVLLVEKSDDHIGGDCLNSGCIPSKALIHVAKEIYTSKHANKFFDTEEHRNVDMQKVIAYIRSKQDYIRKGETPQALQNKGISYISGEAHFVDQHSISLNGLVYTAKNFVLATGSRPRPLSVTYDGSVPLYNNDTIFTIDFLPKRFVYIGGGPINCELGQAFSRLGADVTILHSGERLLEKETEEASAIVAKRFTEEGIVLVYGCRVSHIENKRVYYTLPDSEASYSVEADAIFVGIGRDLNIDTLAIENAGIQRDASGTRLLVDPYLRTTNKHVYVVGDVAGNYQFTHAAEMHAQVVITNMLSPFKKKFDPKHIAWVTYTSPEIATFGCSKREAEASGYKILHKSFHHDDRAIVDEQEDGFVLLYIDSSDHIRGGTVVREGAGEIAQELVLAMTGRLPLSTLFATVYPYPIAGRIHKQIVADYMAERLTAPLITVLRFVYKVL